MELNHDWRGFNSVFQPRRGVGSGAGKAVQPRAETRSDSLEANPRGPIHLITEGLTVLAAQSADGEDFSALCGLTLSQFAEAHAVKGREMVATDRKQVDTRLGDSLAFSNCHEQIEFMRASSKFPAAPSHFLLSGLQTWWAKILPSSYGFFIRLENANGAQPRELFVIIRRGKLALFHAPDLSSLGAERARDLALVVKYLAEKHAVPVQAFSAEAADWAAWSEAGSDSWKKLAIAIRAGQACLVPFRWQLMTLLATRAFFGF